MTTNNNRGFTSNIGAILAAAGGAVGLGNIWRFPYMLGNNGGGAFLLIYVFFVLLIGIPLMMTEFIIGRRAQQNAVGSYRILSGKKGWMLIGIFGVIGAFLIYAFYSVVAGWTLNYLVLACGNNLAGKTPEALTQLFTDFTQDSFWPLLYQFLFLSLTGGVIIFGVQKGIEKVSKVLMPALFLLLILMSVRSLTLGDGVREGLSFLFKPDFSKIDGSCLLSALGQSFFSLSIGMGAMVTYGSYIRKQDKLFSSSLWIAGCDSLVAILAGIVIFPAVFAFGMSPSSGPKLVYVVLPNVFNNMPGGTVFAIIFFLLLSIAALTSTISLLEIIVAVAVEEFHWKRINASIIASLCVFNLGALCTLSFGPMSDVHIFGYTIFDLFDKVTASYIMPIGALAMTIFLGWFFPKTEVRDELSNGGTLKVKAFELYYFILRYVAPLALIVIMISSIAS